MELPKIDGRTKEDIVQYIKKNLSSYVPEWRFDEKNPDVGTALALIYADMMSETVYRFNQVLEKNRMVFFEKIGAKLHSAIPASGYVTFSLVSDDVESVEVRRNEKVIAEGKEGENLIFETLQDVYVTPTKPECIYLCEKEKDYIQCLFERKEEEEVPCGKLFDLRGVNLQEHILYFSHPSILNIQNEAVVYCSFTTGLKKKFEEKYLHEFAKEENVVFEYYSSKGFLPFEEIKIELDQIVLKKGENQPAFALMEQDGTSGYWIRCKVKDIAAFENMSVNALALRSKGQNILPEMVHANGVDQKIEEFFPFGERASLYDEVYFISDEVFGKKGASITLDFELDYFKLPMEVQEIENEINWKAIMKRSEVKADIEYDISIAEVIWEYYNGDGFTRLFRNEQYSDIFGIQAGTMSRKASIHFQCPLDIEPLLINSVNGYCIRARVLKMNNLYKMKGNYISPLISNLRMNYEYVYDNLAPEYFMAENNLERKVFRDFAMKVNEIDFYPLEGRTEKEPVLYLGFSKAPIGGPIKMLFSMEETITQDMPLLQFEYYSKKGWKTLTVVDETRNFQKTGIITMIGNTDFEKLTMHGKDMYWLRVIDVNREYTSEKGQQVLPKLQGIYMNTTPVMAVETKEPEWFYVLPNEEKRQYQLKEGQICHIQVWVNEYHTLHKDKLSEVENLHDIRYEYTKEGILKEIWVKWKEVNRFTKIEDELQGRCYMVDRITGLITFPNNPNSLLPASDEEPVVCVEYSCGGGQIGNLPAHSIQKLNRSIGFIGAVDNHEITTGGCEQEQVKDALKCNAAAIRHRYRAVTASDYEALAYEATRNICKVKCFSSRNEVGEKAYGQITLVVLQKDYENARKYFSSIREQIMNYMKAHMSTHLVSQDCFHIVEPDFIELSAIITVEVAEYNHIFDVRTAILKRMEEFLNPITGNYNHSGWEIGEVPNATQISNALKEIKEIHYIENVRLVAYRKGRNGTIEVDMDKIRQYPYVLPLNGTHEIIVKVKN